MTKVDGGLVQIDMRAALACYRDQSRFVRAFVWEAELATALALAAEGKA